MPDYFASISGNSGNGNVELREADLWETSCEAILFAFIKEEHREGLFFGRREERGDNLRLEAAASFPSGAAEAFVGVEGGVKEASEDGET